MWLQFSKKVVETENGLRGIDAVIDKDKSSSRLAQELKADMLIILTAVDQVYINFNKPGQKALEEISIAEAKKYIAEGQFARGSMLPKVEACIDFVEALPGRCAVITSLEKAGCAIHGKAGTRIRSEQEACAYVPLELDSEVYDVNAG